MPNEPKPNDPVEERLDAPAPNAVPADDDAPVASSDVDWDDLDKDDEEPVQADEPVKADASPPASETPPESVTPPKASETPTPEPTKPAPVASPPPQPSAEEMQRLATEKRNATVAELVKAYGISEDDAPKLITEPETVLPQLFAKLHMEVQDRVLDGIRRDFPGLLEQHQAATTNRQEAIKAFYTAWPELDKPEYGETVARILVGYRQANPDVDRDKIINEGGMLALTALKIPLPERLIKTEERLVRDNSPGYEPERASGRVPQPPAQKSDNEFTVIAEEDLEDEVVVKK